MGRAIATGFEFGEVIIFPELPYDVALAPDGNSDGSPVIRKAVYLYGAPFCVTDEMLFEELARLGATPRSAVRWLCHRDTKTRSGGRSVVIEIPKEQSIPNEVT